jgi:predicted NBD/HSP70 family sugar kinase
MACRQTRHHFLAAAIVQKLTKSNFFVESNAVACLLGEHFLGGEEHAVLLLEGSFSLKISHLWRSLFG